MLFILAGLLFSFLVGVLFIATIKIEKLVAEWGRVSTTHIVGHVFDSGEGVRFLSNEG